MLRWLYTSRDEQMHILPVHLARNTLLEPKLLKTCVLERTTHSSLIKTTMVRHNMLHMLRENLSRLVFFRFLLFGHDVRNEERPARLEEERQRACHSVHIRKMVI